MRNDPRMHRPAPGAAMFTNHTPPGEFHPVAAPERRGEGRTVPEGTEGWVGPRLAHQRGRGPRDCTRPDARVREDVCECLTEDPQLDARGIEVGVQDGSVTLDGVLPLRWLKHHAENLAAQCRGVREVVNRIRVEKQDRTGDASQAGYGRYGAQGKSFGGWS
jgi:hypothetical protein